MTIIEAIVLGIVQGLTEFLPISSTAHLRVVPALVGWEDPGAGFTAVIQLGTLLAVLVYFWRDLAASAKGVARALRSAEQSLEARLGVAILVGTVPISIAGLLLKEYIEGPFRSLWVIVGTLVGVALILVLAEAVGRRERFLQEVTWRDGLWVGICQAFALVPGVSRSGSTIAGALLLGFEREAAARFSFLLSIPSIFLAGVFELYTERHALLEQGALSVSIATVAAFISGYASIEFLLRFLRTRTLFVFILYRIALGLLLAALLSFGVLLPEE